MLIVNRIEAFSFVISEKEAISIQLNQKISFYARFYWKHRKS